MLSVWYNIEILGHAIWQARRLIQEQIVHLSLYIISKPFIHSVVMTYFSVLRLTPQLNVLYKLVLPFTLFAEMIPSRSS